MFLEAKKTNDEINTPYLMANQQICSKIKYSSTLIIVFCLLPFFGISESYRYVNYTKDNGLLSSEVFDILQDSKGFIWIATNYGVNRFDGYRFESFDLTSGLADNTILELYEDYRGRIWFVSLTGRLSYYFNGRIHTFPHNNLIDAYKNRNAVPYKKTFLVDKQDNVYLSLYESGSIRVNFDGTIQNLTPIRKEGKLSYIKVAENNHLMCNSVQKQNQDGTLNCDLLIVDNNEEYIIDTKMKANAMVTYTAANKDYIYASGGKYLSIINRKKKTYRKICYEKKIIWLSIDDNGIVWVGFLGGGLKGYRDSQLNSLRYELLGDYSVSSIVQDKEGGYWLSTLEGGIFYYPSLDLNALTVEGGLSSAKITNLDIKNGIVWFSGEQGGLFSYDRKRLVVHDDKEYNLVSWQGDSLFVSLALAESSAGYQTRIIYNSEIIQRFNHGFGEVLKVDADTFYLYYNGFWKLVKGVFLPNKSVEWPNRYFYDLCFNDEGDLWIGTEIGLFLYKKSGQLVSMADSNKLYSYRVQCLEYLHGNLWIGTRGAGLLCKTPDTLLNYTAKHGLPSNTINSLLMDNDTIWAGTNSGVAKIIEHQNQLNVQKWSIEEGLYNDEVGGIVMDNEFVYVATNNGLCYFDKNKSPINTCPPPVYISTIEIMGRDTSNCEYLELEYSQNHLTFEFVGVSYKRTRPLQYQYKLEGLDLDWKQTEQTKIQYTSLEPGNYTFKVKAINNSGVYSILPATVTIKILEPFWRTTWFLLLCILGGAGLIACVITIYFSVRMRNYKKQNYLINKMNKYRQQALSSQMNPHFIYNSLNSVQNYILKNDPYTSSEYLTKLGTLMRRILNNSQFETISLKEELKALFIYIEMELVRFRNSFEFEKNIDKNIDLESIAVPPLILQPFVENAIRHGLEPKESNKTLKLGITIENGTVAIIIEDNGIGRQESFRLKGQTDHISLGGEITSKRLDLFNEIYQDMMMAVFLDLYDENEKPKGTKVIIKIKQKVPLCIVDS